MHSILGDVTQIALFATCLGDTLFPDVPRATVTVLTDYRALERVEGVRGPRTLEVVLVAA